MAFNEYYVRNTNGTDTAGQGVSHATAYKTIQFAINDIVTTHGRFLGANQDRLNICDESAFVLTAGIDPTVYGNATPATVFVLQGYTAAPGDGGRFAVDLNGGVYSVIEGSHDYWTIADGAIYNNTGSKALWDMDGVGQKALRMEFYDNSYRAIDGAGTNGASADLCYFHDCSGVGVYRIQRVTNSLFVNGVTAKFTTAIAAYRYAVHRCLFYLDGASNGIDIDAYTQATNNTILSNGGTGSGITCSLYFRDLVGNVIEGFSGAGGIGIEGYNSTQEDWHRSNACFNNETDYSGQAAVNFVDGNADNETLLSSGIAKAGSLPTNMASASFWADVYAYFAPVDVGNMLTGYPSGANLAKGAVQPAAGGGGGDTVAAYNRGRIDALRQTGKLR